MSNHNPDPRKTQDPRTDPLTPGDRATVEAIRLTNNLRRGYDVDELLRVLDDLCHRYQLRLAPLAPAPSADAPAEVPCDVCGGSGELECRLCDHGKEINSWGNVVDCSDCDGKGKRKCQHCKGTGKLETPDESTAPEDATTFTGCLTCKRISPARFVDGQWVCQICGTIIGARPPLAATPAPPATIDTSKPDEWFYFDEIGDNAPAPSADAPAEPTAQAPTTQIAYPAAEMKEWHLSRVREAIERAAFNVVYPSDIVADLLISNELAIDLLDTLLVRGELEKHYLNGGALVGYRKSNAPATPPANSGGNVLPPAPATPPAPEAAKTAKLTKAQIRLLRRIANGERIYKNPFDYSHRGTDYKVVSSIMIGNLLRDKIIGHKYDPIKGREFLKLTDAGRAALKAVKS